jgi:hypothetical protein
MKKFGMSTQCALFEVLLSVKMLFLYTFPPDFGIYAFSLSTIYIAGLMLSIQLKALKYDIIPIIVPNFTIIFAIPTMYAGTVLKK